MSPLRALVFVAVLTLSFGLQPAIAAQNDPKDVAAIREVVEAFRTSIIKKDKETFVSLFVSDNPAHVTWQLVDDDARVARLKTFVPEVRRVVRWPENNFLTMIDRITAVGSESIEEVFRDPVIDTDDVPPSLSSTAIWSPIPNDKEIGREEAFYRRANHRLPA